MEQARTGHVRCHPWGEELAVRVRTSCRLPQPSCRGRLAAQSWGAIAKFAEGIFYSFHHGHIAFFHRQEPAWLLPSRELRGASRNSAKRFMIGTTSETDEAI